MLKKEFLLYLHQDWLSIVEQLQSELHQSGDDRPAQLQRIHRASEWIAHYAKQLKDLYGVEA